jgi:riboflavin synthase
MFTGLIKELGIVVNRGDGKLTITAGRLASTCCIGESVAVSGVCLTVVDISPPRVTMDVLEETIARTNLGLLKSGDMVNLEPALKVGGELGGHFVTGHVDGEGKLISRRRSGRDWIFRIELPEGLEKYMVEKGSITIEGISLTVAEVVENIIVVHIIPHTFSHTNLREKREGDTLNIEADLLGKYVISFLEKREAPASSIDRSLLKEAGFI